MTSLPESQTGTQHRASSGPEGGKRPETYISKRCAALPKRFIRPRPERDER
jgi:hypothetical protein